VSRTKSSAGHSSLPPFTSSMTMNENIDMPDAPAQSGGTQAVRKLEAELAIATHQRDSLLEGVRSMTTFESLVGFLPYPIEKALHDNPGGPLQTACRKIGALTARAIYLRLVEDTDELYESPADTLKREYVHMETRCKELLERVKLVANSYRGGLRDLKSSSFSFVHRSDAERSSDCRLRDQRCCPASQTSGLQRLTSFKFKLS